MLIFIFILLVWSNALTTNKEMSIFYNIFINIIAILALLFISYFGYMNIDAKWLGMDFVFYEALFNIVFLAAIIMSIIKFFSCFFSGSLYIGRFAIIFLFSLLLFISIKLPIIAISNIVSFKYITYTTIFITPPLMILMIKSTKGQVINKRDVLASILLSLIFVLIINYLDLYNVLCDIALPGIFAFMYMEAKVDSSGYIFYEYNPNKKSVLLMDGIRRDGDNSPLRDLAEENIYPTGGRVDDNKILGFLNRLLLRKDRSLKYESDAYLNKSARSSFSDLSGIVPFNELKDKSNDEINNIYCRQVWNAVTGQVDRAEKAIKKWEFARKNRAKAWGSLNKYSLKELSYYSQVCESSFKTLDEAIESRRTLCENANGETFEELNSRDIESDRIKKAKYVASRAIDNFETIRDRIREENPNAVSVSTDKEVECIPDNIDTTTKVDPSISQYHCNHKYNEDIDRFKEERERKIANELREELKKNMELRRWAVKEAPAKPVSREDSIITQLDRNAFSRVSQAIAKNNNTPFQSNTNTNVTSSTVNTNTSSSQTAVNPTTTSSQPKPDRMVIDISSGYDSDSSSSSSL